MDEDMPERERGRGRMGSYFLKGGDSFLNINKAGRLESQGEDLPWLSQVQLLGFQYWMLNAASLHKINTSVNRVKPCNQDPLIG